MIITVAELDASIPAPREPERRLPDNAEPPYQLGDLVAVYFQPLVGKPRWVPGMIRECSRKPGARRFECVVALGNSINTQYMAQRIYCWEDGSGDEIVPLPVENPGRYLDTLNRGTFWPQPTPVQAQPSLFDAYPQES